MSLTLKVKTTSDRESEKIRGQLISLLSAIEDVGTRRRRASYIVHFFQERLDRKERRALLRVLAQLITQLSGEDQVSNSLTESEGDDLKLPAQAQRILRIFRNSSGFSAQTTGLHQ